MRAPMSLSRTLAAGATVGALTLLGGLAVATALSGSADPTVPRPGAVAPDGLHRPGVAMAATPTTADHSGRGAAVTFSEQNAACGPAAGHGQYVVGVAHAAPAGDAHGAAVSSAARTDCGSPSPAAAPPATQGGDGGTTATPAAPDPQAALVAPAPPAARSAPATTSTPPSTTAPPTTTSTTVPPPPYGRNGHGDGHGSSGNGSPTTTTTTSTTTPGE